MGRGVVIISGLPAAGKSSLAKRLSDDLGLVWVQRDRLGSDVLADLAEVVSPTERDRIARAKDRLVNAVATAVIDGDSGVVIDGNFNTPEQAASIRSWMTDHGLRAVEICLWGDPAALEERFVQRADPPLTADLKPYFHQVLHRPRWTVLAHPAPVFHLDTTDLAVIDAVYDRLLAALATALLDPGQLLRGPCQECGFDWEAGPDAIQQELGSLGPTVDARLTPHLVDERIAVNPEPNVWSAVEYGWHLRNVLEFYRRRIEQILTTERATLLDSVPRSELAVSDPSGREATIAALRREAAATAELVDGLDQFDWWRVGIGNDGTERSLISLARRVAHESHHHQLDLARVLDTVMAG